MKTGKRLAWHYGRQWILIGAILAFFITAAFFWMADRMNQLELQRNFVRNGWEFISKSISIDSQGNVTWDEDLLKRINKSNGWLQIVDENGNVVKSYAAPADLPNHYTAGEIMAYSMREIPFPYIISTYVARIGERTITAIIGLFPENEQLLSQWISLRVLGTQQALEESNRMLRDNQAWVQRIDAQGREIESWNKPEGAETKYQAFDIIMRFTYPEQYGTMLSYRYFPDSRETWLLHQPYVDSNSTISMAGLPVSNYTHIFGVAWGTVLLLVSIIFIVMAWWQSSRLAKPLKHIMNWTGQIQNGVYGEPANSKGLPLSRRRNGKYKRNYRIYGDVFHAIERMAQRLQEADEERRENDKLREEWLAGISHDMKTPLSSIIGYAHLLNAPQYKWLEQEIAEFADMMKQKAEIMDELIQDLNLTYRLQSGSLPLQLEVVDLRDWLQEEFVHLQPLPENAENRIVCSMPDEEVLFSLDPRYFRRMIDNVCANAFLHNPPDTSLHVQVTKDQQHVELTFSDNGNGMNEQTLANLFNRYYRGTSTDQSGRGSGLGMAIAKQLAEVHGGSVTATSKLGEGTSITFSFPVAVDS